MNSRISKSWRISYSIFLVSIFCHTGTNIAFGEQAVDVTKRAYHITRKKTRTWYKEVKKHKRLIAAGISYLAFEAFGYYHSWDTPLRRLLTPKKLLDDAIQVHAAQIVQLTNDHQQAYAGLERRYEKVKKQLDEKELAEFERQKKVLLEQMEKFEANNS